MPNHVRLVAPLSLLVVNKAWLVPAALLGLAFRSNKRQNPELILSVNLSNQSVDRVIHTINILGTLLQHQELFDTFL